MAKTYTNVGGSSRKVKKAYVNVGGTARKVKKVYANVNGIARLCYNAIQFIGAIPSQSNALMYNGNAQSPTWNGYDPNKMTIGGITSATNAGSYTAIFTAKEGWAWSDGSTSKSVTWSIAKGVITAVPSQSGSLTYNGSNQSPGWNGYNSSMLTIGGTTVGANAGSYTATFTPTSNYKWSDGSVSQKSASWTIGKAAGSVSLSESSITFDSAGGSKAITVTRSGDGAISATSSNTSVATCSVSGNVVTINNGSTDGTCTITIKVAAGTNHTASIDKTVTVTRYICPVPETVGETCTWAGNDWIVCHVEDDRVYLASILIRGYCQFNSNSSNNYAGSNLAARAMTFQNSLPAAALSQTVDTTVHGVTAKIFVASKEQLYGGFSWFNSSARRICKDGGEATGYWTSTPAGAGVSYISSEGYDPGGNHPDVSRGFRPFVAIRRK